MWKIYFPSILLKFCEKLNSTNVMEFFFQRKNKFPKSRWIHSPNKTKRAPIDWNTVTNCNNTTCSKSCPRPFSHYSKSQIFVQKFNFDKTPNIFMSFSPKNFLTTFLMKSKLSTAKKSKTTTFSRVFYPIFFDNFFSWNQSCQQLKSPKPQHFHKIFTQIFL